jgi:hypothetical protein
MPKLPHSPLHWTQRAPGILPLRQFQFPDRQEARNHFSILDIRVVDACNLGKLKARWGVSVPRSDNRDKQFESQYREPSV